MNKVFRYEAYDSDGALVRGEIEADSRDAALSNLRARKLFPFSAEDAGATRILDRQIFLSPPISRGGAALLIRELSALLSAEIPVDVALSVAGADLRPGRAKTVILDMQQRVRRGERLSDAMRAHGDVFQALEVALVRAGEAGGDVAGAMTTAADLAERALTLRAKIISAMIYPSILSLRAIAAVLIVTTVLAPSLSPMFERTGEAPPAMFAAMLGFSFLVKHYWWAIIAVGAGLALLARRALRNEAISSGAELLLLRTPGLGKIIANLETSRLFRALAALLASGAPLPEALSIGRDVSSTKLFRRAAAEARERVRQGETLAASFANCAALPPAAQRLLQIGERSGRLDQMLGHAATQADTAAQRGIDRLLTALNPALTIVLGLIVGGMIAAVLSTILSANELLFS